MILVPASQATNEIPADQNTNNQESPASPEPMVQGIFNLVF